jgi:hypothetical protein
MHDDTQPTGAGPERPARWAIVFHDEGDRGTLEVQMVAPDADPEEVEAAVMAFAYAILQRRGHHLSGEEVTMVELALAQSAQANRMADRASGLSKRARRVSLWATAANVGAAVMCLASILRLWPS